MTCSDYRILSLCLAMPPADESYGLWKWVSGFGLAVVRQKIKYRFAMLPNFKCKYVTLRKPCDSHTDFRSAVPRRDLPTPLAVIRQHSLLINPLSCLPPSPSAISTVQILCLHK